ncbi:alpha/beta hydrolase family protein [Parapedobacter koreensis]|uniref:Prolyl oligopeptidase family protein n=1 Tax=Parapedobacter koreensis TaxID=332977 RepID=A0A1H7LEH2_9SPHI|nr:prolyl oligopeptidase family serine peptidase [Parapedobacter koreensis]SEK97392.1 Prolyl oligopeptidase family protein [Parapedobacter koreensis]
MNTQFHFTMQQIAIFFLLFFVTNVVVAQKKPLDHSVYDGWQNISTSAISKDGHFIYYIISPQEGDAQLVVTTPSNQQLGRIDRAANVNFSPDEKFLVALIKPFYRDTREAKIKKKKPDEMPKDSLAIFALATSGIEKIPLVKSYKIPEEAGNHIAYISEQAPALPDTTATDTGKADKPARKKAQSTLHIRNLTDGEETTIERVDGYYFSQDGNALVYVRTAAEKDSIGADAGLYYYDLATKESRHISHGKGEYKNIAFDEAASQLAFTADKSPEKSLQKAFSLYYYTQGQDTAIIIADRHTNGVPQQWNVSGEGNVRFSKNGEKLFFGIAPIPAVKDTTLVEFEHAKVDVWHWQDDYLQPQQLANLRREQNRNYLAVTYPKKGRKVIPLADEQLPDARITEDADNEFALATTDVGRRIETQWQTGSRQDIYAVSTVDGSRKKIAEDIRGTVSLSPAGNYVIWYNRLDANWYSHDIQRGNTVLLNADLPVSFADEDNDVPDEPNGYGVAGWSEEDEEVFIYDKYDIWAFHPDGSERRLVTNGAGRSNQITFRYQDLESDRSGLFRRGGATTIDVKKPWILSAFNHTTKENGWYTTNGRNNHDPKDIIIGPYRYGQINRAKDADFYSYTKENYVSAPDLYVSTDLVKETKLSAINQQQQQYNWGTAELMKWTTPKGYAAEGILYKPEDFDPNKKYPVIAYFYEKLSDGLYSYLPPAPTPSRLNISFFVSNGYLVLAPDIRYETGHPGQSAEEFVNSGMEALKAQPWVDGEKMAIQGQSWGGYQVAHLITRTNMYAAAWAGAPVVNMTSAYGGIRWESGMNRQFQYERTQSRIGATLWENPELYIENSPLFHLPNVTTPVVIMSNDEDGAVPWYQGIEMFTALRRLQKPVWMLNYNGEAHNLVQRQNRKDIQRRQLEFFDHFLKGKPAAPWIDKGVPAVMKGIDWGFGN